MTLTNLMLVRIRIWTIGGTSEATLNISKMIKCHNLYDNSETKMVLKNVRVQKVFRIVSAVTISKTICCIECDIS